MKKFIFFALALTLALALTACGDSVIINGDNIYIFEATPPPEITPPPLPTDPQVGNELPTPTDPPEDYIYDLMREWSVEELSKTIVESGQFWEEWWNVTGRFSFDNTGELGSFLMYSYVELLQSSGFGNLDDIRKYLLQYYTEALVDEMLWVDEMMSAAVSPFVEYDGMLYIHMVRMCSSRPNWDSATHILIDQVGGIAFVESTVIYYDYEVGEVTESGIIPYAFERTHKFTFIHGRINETSICPIWLE